ncbi:MAG: hypothetical protein AAGB46_06495 [Verrucomicrobiota bacterium]
MSIFTLLFGSDTNEEDGWTQPQREALINLLTLAMYADSHLSLSEQQAIDAHIEKLYWNSDASVEAFSNRSITRARDARNNDELKQDYLSDIADQLGDAKGKAYEICKSVLASDGHAEEEAAFLSSVKTVFKI